VPDVFISYSRSDTSFVSHLADELRERGKDVWMDVDGIRDAEKFPEALRRAIEGSNAFVFVISPDSVGSEYCFSDSGTIRLFNSTAWRTSCSHGGEGLFAPGSSVEHTSRASAPSGPSGPAPSRWARFHWLHCRSRQGGRSSSWAGI
jgi:hypothetical protein